MIQDHWCPRWAQYHVEVTSSGLLIPPQTRLTLPASRLPFTLQYSYLSHGILWKMASSVSAGCLPHSVHHYIEGGSRADFLGFHLGCDTWGCTILNYINALCFCLLICKMEMRVARPAASGSVHWLQWLVKKELWIKETHSTVSRLRHLI
jgi:hypothetical protein